MDLKQQLGREVVRKFPSILYSLAFTIYWRIHPFRNNVTLIPKSDSIHIIKEDMELFHPIKHGFSTFIVRKGKPPSLYKEFCSLEEGSIVVDAGAGIGRDTIVMAKEVGESGRVIAIEPSPSNINLLKKNLKLNNMVNVDVVRKGLWSKRGNSEIFITDRFTDHSMIKELPREIEGKVKIQTDTLDNILSELGLENKRIELIKMNIEGAEVEALKGSKRTLRNTEQVLVQTHRRKNFDTTNEVNRMLKSEGFKISGRKKRGNRTWIYASHA